MATQPSAAGARVPLQVWAPVHPAAAAFAAGAAAGPAPGPGGAGRSRALAGALAELNRKWGNPVDDELARWIAGADAVVTGQQPGLLGGPLLTLVKAAAVAAEVSRRRAAGRDAVGFLWLATADDDLPEMGWGRVAAGDEPAEVREPGWARGAMLGGAAPLSGACAAFLEALRPQLPGENARAGARPRGGVLRPGDPSRRGDRPLPRAPARRMRRCARRRARARAGARGGASHRPRPRRAFPAAGTHSRRGARACASAAGRCRCGSPRRSCRCSVASAIGGSRCRRARGRVPPRSSPSTRPTRSASSRTPGCGRWSRTPLSARAVSILGGAELAYHLQTEDVRAVAGIGRPEWRLRPHVTVVTSAERRLARQLEVQTGAAAAAATAAGDASRPDDAPPAGALARDRRERDRRAGGRRPRASCRRSAATSRRRRGSSTRRWRGSTDGSKPRRPATPRSRWDAGAGCGRSFDRTANRRSAASRSSRRCSGSGLEWPRQLVASLDPGDPGMHLLFWERGRGVVGRCDVLAVGAHPDDVELGCGGNAGAAGRAPGAVSESSTSPPGSWAPAATWTARTREAEAAAAALGVAWRFVPRACRTAGSGRATTDSWRPWWGAARRRSPASCCLPDDPTTPTPTTAAAATLHPARGFPRRASLSIARSSARRTGPSLLLAYPGPRQLLAPALVVDVIAAYARQARGAGGARLAVRPRRGSRRRTWPPATSWPPSRGATARAATSSGRSSARGSHALGTLAADEVAWLLGGAGETEPVTARSSDARSWREGSMKIGVTCYPTVGGSGTVATELGLAIASRGHEVHFICYALPYRLGRVPPGVTFHEVTVPTYPLFPVPTVLAGARVADGGRGAHPRDRAPARALRDPARDLRPPGARDPGRRSEAGRDPARHRHHGGRGGPLVPARSCGSGSSAPTRSRPSRGRSPTRPTSCWA